MVSKSKGIDKIIRGDLIIDKIIRADLEKMGARTMPPASQTFKAQI